MFPSLQFKQRAGGNCVSAYKAEEPKQPRAKSSSDLLFKSRPIEERMLVSVKEKGG